MRTVLELTGYHGGYGIFLVNVEERKEFDRMEKNEEELEKEREELEAKIAEIQRQLEEHDAKRAEQGETVGTVPSPPKPVVAKEKQPVSCPKPNVAEEKQAESGQKVHKPLPKARNDWDNSYTQEIIESIQLKEIPKFRVEDVKKYMPNTNPRSVFSIGRYKARMINIGMSREEVHAKAAPYIMVVNLLEEEIIDYMEQEETPYRDHIKGDLVALALGMLIDHEREYLGLFNLGNLRKAIIHAVVGYGSFYRSVIFKNGISFDDMDVPDYVFSWIETPAYLEPDLYLHFRGEV